MARPRDDLEGAAILAVWAGALAHVAKLIEPAFREGFSAAQLGTADCGAAWEDSLAKAARTGVTNASDWAIRAADL